jgi:hypothetical protein
MVSVMSVMSVMMNPGVFGKVKALQVAEEVWRGTDSKEHLGPL